MFKKRSKKNIRERQNWEEASQDENPSQENEESVQDGATKDASVPSKKSQPVSTVVVTTKMAASGRSLLSFEDELDGDVEEFQLKKSRESVRLARERKEEKERKKQERERKKREKEDKKKQELMALDDDDDDEAVPSLTDRLEQGYVPDSFTIHMIKKKREMARKMGVNSVDYIPLDEDRKFGAVRGKSRLIREDDNDRSDEDAEDDEGGSRVRTFGNKPQPANKQMEVLAALENIGSDYEDETTRRWEEEQITKGMKASQPQEPSPPPALPADQLIAQSFVYGAPTTMYPPSFASGAGFAAGRHGHLAAYQEPQPKPPAVARRPGPSLPDKLVPITLETVKSQLQNKLSSLEEDNSSHRQRLQQVKDDLVTVSEEIDRQEALAPTVGLEYQFFQQMRGYLRDLLSCLAEKSRVIEALEKRVLQVHRQKAALLVERRRQDVRDEAEECSAPNGGIELGPAVEARQRRSVEREARRRRRREARERKAKMADHDEGMSSDDELLEANRMKFSDELDGIRSSVEEVFSDVVEDFSSLREIRQRLEQWKFGSPESYGQAYVSLCLPRLFAPLVRYEVLLWNPLEEESMAIEEMEWFSLLLFYGYREGEEPSLSDGDSQLLPQLVDKVLIPKLTDLVQHVWDPLSAMQTQRLTSLITSLQEDYPTVTPANRNTKAFLGAVVCRLQAALEEDMFIPLMSKMQLENTNSMKYLFYHRQFWKCVKLLSNLLLWEGSLPGDVVRQLGADHLLGRYLLLALQNSPPSIGAIRKVEKIVSLLPPSWLQRGTLPAIKSVQGLKRFLMQYAETCYRASLGFSGQKAKDMRSVLTRILKTLVRINANEEAIAVATQYKLAINSQ